MHDFIMAKDSELWDIVLDGPYVPMNEVKEVDITRLVQKLEESTTNLIRRRWTRTIELRKYSSVG